MANVEGISIIAARYGMKAGIDVSKSHLDVSISAGKVRSSCICAYANPRADTSEASEGCGIFVWVIR